MPRKPQVRFHTASRQYYVHIAGKQYYLGSEKNSAEALGARLIADHLAGQQAQLQNRVVAGDQPELLFINQLVLLYTDYRRERYSVKDGRVSSQRAMDKAALDMLLQYYKHVPAAKFGPVELERLQEALADRGKLSRSTINKYIGCIRCMFRWAVRRKLVPADTYHYLTAVPGLRFGQTRAPETDPVKPVPEKDFRNTLRYLPKTVARMALLQYLTGMRPMEVCLMRPRDIDMTDTVWSITNCSQCVRTPICDSRQGVVRTNRESPGFPPASVSPTRC
jgi:hypothetical protein